MNSLLTISGSLLFLCGVASGDWIDDLRRFCRELPPANVIKGTSDTPFPFDVGVLRDGGTRAITVEGDVDGSRTVFIDFSLDSSFRGRMFRREDWDKRGKPLSHEEAMLEFSKLEEMAKTFFNTQDLSGICVEAEKMEREPEEVRRKLYSDPEAMAKLRTLHLRDEIENYRESFEAKD